MGHFDDNHQISASSIWSDRDMTTEIIHCEEYVKIALLVTFRFVVTRTIEINTSFIPKASIAVTTVILMASTS